MKIFLVILFSLFYQFVYSQREIKVYYGFPNFGELMIQAFSSHDIKGLGPLGLSFYNELNNSNQIGVDLIVNGIVNNWSYTTDTSSIRTENFMIRFRPQLRYNWVFKNNFYLGLGAGLNVRYAQSKENGVKILSDIVKYDWSLFNTPLSGRFCVGYRLNLSDNFILSSEIGIGGPLINVGLSFSK